MGARVDIRTVFHGNMSVADRVCTVVGGQGTSAGAHNQATSFYLLIPSKRSVSRARPPFTVLSAR